MAKKIKTLKGWEKTDLSLDQYLDPMDEVNEELFLHCAEAVAPQYCDREFLQMGEAEFEREGVFFYMTFSEIDARYYYLGKLPEFRQ